MHGQFIVLEGPDGSGTTSNSQLLADALRAEGRDVVLTCEPTDGHVGKYIRTQLAQKTIPSPAALQLLFCADRALHVDSLIVPALQDGKTVICDRYWPSTVIYGHASGLDPEWLKEVNSHFPVPDVMMYLIPPFATCMERIGHRMKTDVFEGEVIQKKVHDIYVRMTKNHPHVIDSSGPRAETAKQVLAVVKRH